MGTLPFRSEFPVVVGFLDSGHCRDRAGLSTEQKRTERELHSTLAGINFLRFGHPFLRKEAEIDGKRRVQAGHRGQRPGPQAL